jgi:hypothetical protein
LQRITVEMNFTMTGSDLKNKKEMGREKEH